MAAFMSEQTDEKHGGRDIDSRPVPQQSAGSSGHSQGVCKPCVWFWRPASCSKGQSCEYCHLCDEGAVSRAKAMRRAIRKTASATQYPGAHAESDDAQHNVMFAESAAPSSTSLELSDAIYKLISETTSVGAFLSDCETPLTSMPTVALQCLSVDASEDRKPIDADSSSQLGQVSSISFDNKSDVPSYSLGSSGHAQGLCRPCVWFWRPTSCSKGSSCEYCHLCDEGAVKRAKLARRVTSSVRKCNSQSSYAFPSVDSPRCNVVPPGLSAELVPHEISPIQVQFASEASSLDSSDAFDRSSIAKDAINDDSQNKNGSSSVEQSIGSRGHSQRLCKPCVWFWRPSSCSKGQSCEYCHMCDEGAVGRSKAMRRSVRATLKNRANAGTYLSGGTTLTSMPIVAPHSLLKDTTSDDDLSTECSESVCAFSEQVQQCRFQH